MGLRSIKGKGIQVAQGADVETIVGTYRSSSRRKVLGMLFFLLLIILASGFAMGIGSYEISFTGVYSMIWEHLTHWSDGYTSVDMRVVWEQRLPRLLFAIISGAGLAATGAAMQSMLKNPLADSYTTGISSGASFGATLAITMGITVGGFVGNVGIVANAFLFSLIPSAVILGLSIMKKASPSTMILAGISVMYIFNALTSYMMLVADEQSMSAAYEWTMGSLSKASWNTMPIMFIVTAVGSFLIFYMSRYLNAMNAGDDFAKTLGVNVQRIRVVLLAIISIVAASIVSFTGIIGFVGLVGPHMARIVIGSDNKYLIPASMLTGATIMVVCDIIAKAFTHVAIPIGIVTSLIGGPVFLILILRQRKEVW
ncbi:MAG: iron ABC transporter permease [Candidatus Methanomethylophilaceae archaeon]|nr:iron ABC transporter permease [Candidatus Methanomethylophilaceae archaeon]MBR6870208.1 iron ABC transporter permease [Candidatus Methanomethylophilaceae archaeon]